MIIIKYTHLEDFIRDFYTNLSIDTPEQLRISEISRKQNIKIHYASVSFWYENNIIIKRSTKQKEWQVFGHEIGHYLRHYGNQLSMHYLFRDYQEYQANYFAYHFCVPTFMLDQLKDVTAYDIMNLFNVEEDFAYRRLEIYQNKCYERMSYGAL